MVPLADDCQVVGGCRRPSVSRFPIRLRTTSQEGGSKDEKCNEGRISYSLLALTNILAGCATLRPARPFRNRFPADLPTLPSGSESSC